MQVTVIGAGAIGGTVGAHLARAGHAVTFCDTVEAHVTAMNQHGLTIRGWAEQFTIPASAVRPDELRGPLDTVLLAVKAQHTTRAMQVIAPLLSADGVVVSMQNGLNEQVIAAAVGGERTIGCLVNFSADYLEPGLIHYGGPGTLKIGELDGRITPRLERLRAILTAWGAVETTPNIWGYLWGKLAYGAMLFATALTNESIAGALAMPEYRPLYIALAREILAVATARGVAPESFDGFDPAAYLTSAPVGAAEQSLDALVAHNQRSAKSHSGIWRDLAVRKRPTEVDAQLGIVVALGRDAGVPTPLTTRLVELIHAIERGVRPQSLDVLDALAATLSPTARA